MNKMMSYSFGLGGTQCFIFINIKRDTHMFNISAVKPPVTTYTGSCRLLSIVFTGIRKMQFTSDEY